MQTGAKIAEMPAPPPTESETPRFAVRHYSVREIAKMWGLSDDLVRRQFEHEPGVVTIGASRTDEKRKYHTLRIPQDVVERVYRRLQIPERAR